MRGMSSKIYPQSGDAHTWIASFYNSRFSELISFGAVGAIAFVVDLTIFNLLLHGPLSRYTITAKVVSVIVATTVAWLGNRFLTFRAHRTQPVLREGVLFAVSNLLGLGIAALCLFVSHYLLGFVTPLADNIAANGVGLVLGTTFRYFSYRLLVFPATTEGAPE